MNNDIIYLSVTLENDMYTVISSKQYSGFKEIEINKNKFYKNYTDNLDILSQETVDTEISIFTDTYAHNKISKEISKTYNINIFDCNYFFLCRSNILFELYDIKTIEERVKIILNINSDIDEVDNNKKIKDIIPFLVESDKIISYLGSNKQYIKNVTNPKNLYKSLIDKPIINPYSLNVISFDKHFNLNDIDNIKKLTYIMDIYEGLIGIKNLVVDSDVLKQLNLFRNVEDDEYLYISFPFLRYLFNKYKITNIEINRDIIIGTKMYIDYRSIFDIADSRIFSTTMMLYYDYYFILLAMETFKDKLVTIDLNVLEFFTTSNIKSPIFIEKSDN